MERLSAKGRDSTRIEETSSRSIELLETVDPQRDLARTPLDRCPCRDPPALPARKLGGAPALRRVSGLAGHRQDGNRLGRTPAGLDMGAPRGKAAAGGSRESGCHLPRNRDER